METLPYQALAIRRGALSILTVIQSGSISIAPLTRCGIKLQLVETPHANLTLQLRRANMPIVGTVGITTVEDIIPNPCYRIRCGMSH